MDTSTISLSPHVRNIAYVVYSEFESLVSKYGQGVVDGIVPIMIRTLEQVDLLHKSNEILQSTNDQSEKEIFSLTSRLEREIKSRRLAEEKIIALEDEISEVRVKMDSKLADFTKLAHIFETKLDAANEHIARQEAKEAELRSDLASAQARCNELLCSHVAHMERTRNRMQNLTLEKPSSSSGISQFIPPTSEVDFLDSKEVHQKNFSQPIVEDPVVLQPATGSSPSVNRTSDEELIDVLDEPTDYEQYLNEPTSTRVVSDESDDISKVSDDYDFMGSESLEVEVKKLVAENQDLTEMKNALNILKDDLLSQIDDLSGNIIILENDLKACRGQLASERGLAIQRERQLTHRIQELTSRLWVAEKLLENARTGAIVRCVSERRIHDLSFINTTATRRRRTKSSEAILTAVSALNPTTGKSNGTPCSYNANSTPGDDTLVVDKRQIARIILQRNHYKERFFEAQDRLRAIEIEAQTQSEASQHLRKRDMALSLFAGLIEGVRNFAGGVKQELGEFIAQSPESPSSSPLAPSATSTALRNILGNFVGQAVTYTADAVLGTGNDLPRDVSRPMIAARVNSNLSNKTEIDPPDVPTSSGSHPMYTDHLL
nr:JNK interacting protein [Hymenolepis microstoma]